MMSLGLPGKGDTGFVWCWNHIYTLCSDSTSENVFSFLQECRKTPAVLAVVWLGFRNAVAYVREGKRMFEGLEREAISRKMFAMVLGYRTELSRLRSTFYLYPMEQIVEDKNGSHLTFKLFVNAETERDRDFQQFAEAATRLGYGGKVWVTPGLPMLVFALIGLGLTITFGDVILGTVVILARR